MTTPSPISTVQADIAKLQALWAAASAQYEAKKAELAKTIDDYVATHATAAAAHTAEIAAATALKATIVPTVSGADAAVTTLEDFVLSTSWGKKAAAWVVKQQRYLFWLLGVVALYAIYRFA
jgi:hypothetical protein